MKRKHLFWSCCFFIFFLANCRSSDHLTLSQVKSQLKRMALVDGCDLIEAQFRSAVSMTEGRYELLRMLVSCKGKLGQLEQLERDLQNERAELGEGLVLYGAALITVYQYPGRLKESLSMMGRAALAAPHIVEIPYRSGILLMSNEERAAARVEISKANKIAKGQSGSVLVALAHLSLDFGEEEKGLDYLRQAAQLELSRRDLLRGRRLIQRIQRRRYLLHQDLMTRYEGLVASFGKSKNSKEAIVRALALVQDAPRFHLGYLLLGRLYFGDSRYAEALIQMKKAAVLAKNDYLPHYYISQVYQHMKRWDKSQFHLKQALFFHPLSVEILTRLVDMFREQGQAKKAIVYLKKLEKLNDGRADFFERLARLSSELGLRKNAITYLKKAKAINPKKIQLNYLLAKTMVRNTSQEKEEVSQSEKAEAIALLEALLEKDPQHLEAFRLLTTVKERL